MLRATKALFSARPNRGTGPTDPRFLGADFTNGEKAWLIKNNKTFPQVILAKQLDPDCLNDLLQLLNSFVKESCEPTASGCLIPTRNLDYFTISGGQGCNIKVACFLALWGIELDEETSKRWACTSHMGQIPLARFGMVLAGANLLSSRIVVKPSRSCEHPEICCNLETHRVAVALEDVPIMNTHCATAESTEPSYTLRLCTDPVGRWIGGTLFTSWFEFQEHTAKGRSGPWQLPTRCIVGVSGAMGQELAQAWLRHVQPLIREVPKDNNGNPITADALARLRAAGQVPHHVCWVLDEDTEYLRRYHDEGDSCRVRAHLYSWVLDNFGTRLSAAQRAKLKADRSAGKCESQAGGALFTLLGVGDDLDSSHCCKDSPCFRWEHFTRESRGANNKRNGCNADGSCNCFPRCLIAGPLANRLATVKSQRLQEINGILTLV
jgi:hypothetical protein